MDLLKYCAKNIKYTKRRGSVAQIFGMLMIIFKVIENRLMSDLFQI